MNAVAEIYLWAQLSTDGSLLINGKAADSGAIGPNVLASLLFAWDEESYYGTFVEQTDNGIKLSGLQSLHFFTSPSRLAFIDFTFSDQLKEYEKIAFLIKSALLSGQFAPDIAAWKNGTTGWKLFGEGHSAPMYANRWLSSIINGAITDRLPLKQAWQKVQRQFPALYVIGDELSPYMGENEWLQSIGLLPDPTPFRTCLRIVEAENDQADWHLQIFLQDRTDPEQLVEISADGVVVDGEIPHHWREYMARFALDMQKCAEIIPWLAQTDGDHPLRTRLGSNEAWRFLTESSLQLVQAGIHVFLPAWWEQVRQTKPTLKAKIKSSVGANQITYFGVSQVMDFEWKLAIGSVELSEHEFYELMDRNQRLMKINGQWIQLTPALLSQIQKSMRNTDWKQGLNLREVLKMHLLDSVEEPDDSFLEDDLQTSLKVDVELDHNLRQLVSRLQQTTHMPMIEQPASFLGTLRKYQLEGSSWLLFLRRFGLGACLADDMGLGKTIQFITYLLHIKENETYHAPSLLICPTSVIGNWQKELERFAPSIKVYIHYGNSRNKDEDFLTTVGDVDLVITSYALSYLDEEDLRLLSWDTICLDEAQHIKNAYTKQARSIRELKAEHKIALTGTPIENRLTELWSIFEFLNPGYLGNLREFSQRFVIPIEGEKNQDLISLLQRLIQPFLLRRVKTDPVIKLDLPEKNESKEFVPLTAEQGALYESSIQGMFTQLEDTSPMQRRGLILSTLTRLKQICDHPSLVLGNGTINDDIHRSHKIERLFELLEDIRGNGERCLIFTQYIQMGNLLQRMLQEEGYGPVYFLNGATPKDKRDEMISQFQDPSLPETERPWVFILSLRAGGIGLNLTAANHVFHIDRWWNPAVESQATDRAYRIGQTRDVRVYKFITLGTIEERIDDMMERKLNLSQKIVDSGENWITELSTAELRDLFSLRKEWIHGRE